MPAQPVGFRPELPNALYDSQTRGWGAEVVKRRPDITTEMADQFLTKMFRDNPDFVFTVTRDFVTGISDLPALDGPFIHPKAAQRPKLLFVTASSRFRGRQLSPW